MENSTPEVKFWAQIYPTLVIGSDIFDEIFVLASGLNAITLQQQIESLITQSKWNKIFAVDEIQALLTDGDGYFPGRGEKKYSLFSIFLNTWTLFPVKLIISGTGLSLTTALPRVQSAIAKNSAIQSLLITKFKGFYDEDETLKYMKQFLGDFSDKTGWTEQSFKTIFDNLRGKLKVLYYSDFKVIFRKIQIYYKFYYTIIN